MSYITSKSERLRILRKSKGQSDLENPPKCKKFHSLHRRNLGLNLGPLCIVAIKDCPLTAELLRVLYVKLQYYIHYSMFFFSKDALFGKFYLLILIPQKVCSSFQNKMLVVGFVSRKMLVAIK